MRENLRYYTHVYLRALWSGLKVFAFIITLIVLVLSIWVARDWWEFSPTVAYTAVVIAALCVVVVVLSIVVWFMEHDMFPDMNVDEATAD